MEVGPWKNVIVHGPTSWSLVSSGPNLLDCATSSMIIIIMMMMREHVTNF